MSTSWRTIALSLGALCIWQQWRSCNRPVTPTVAECAPAKSSSSTRHANDERLAPDRDVEEAPPVVAPKSDGPMIYGVRIPPWAAGLVPAPGEDLRAYRDRMIPLAQIALAPHRARVARSFEDFAQQAHLDDHQRATLDASAKETAQAIQDRVFEAALSGELAPRSFKPMAGVGLARDVLDLVDKANQKFVAGLSGDQRSQLAQHPFDFGDYLLFSTRWEDAISGL